MSALQPYTRLAHDTRSPGAQGLQNAPCYNAREDKIADC